MKNELMGGGGGGGGGGGASITHLRVGTKFCLKLTLCLFGSN